LFQSYTGKYPFFDIPIDPTVILKVMHGERPGRPACSVDRIMSDELWDLVNACWKQDPSERPQMVDVVDKMVRMSMVS
jgi:hypothetical protein